MGGKSFPWSSEKVWGGGKGGRKEGSVYPGQKREKRIGGRMTRAENNLKRTILFKVRGEAPSSRKEK